MHPPQKKNQTNTPKKKKRTTKNMYAYIYGYSVYFPLPSLRIVQFYSRDVTPKIL